MNILFTLEVPEYLQTLQAEKFPDDTSIMRAMIILPI